MEHFTELAALLDRILDDDTAWHELTDREQDMISHHLSVVAPNDHLAAEDADLRVKAIKEERP